MEFKFNFLGTESDASKEKTPSNNSIIPAQEIYIRVVVSTTEAEPIPELPGIVKRSFQAIKASLPGFHADSTTDVIPRVYEGGLKTWECSIDLAQFLISNTTLFDASSVLELGCGSALPSLVLNPPHLILQDYNAQVLESVSAPNLHLNKFSGQVRFFCGDWSGLPELLPPGSCSLILTSETIYRPENYHFLLNIFKHSLSNRPLSCVLVAAKDYYFGLGGSVEEFSSVARSDGWVVERIWSHSEGVPRSILKLTRRKELKNKE